jgi:hypothetical protein
VVVVELGDDAAECAAPAVDAETATSIIMTVAAMTDLRRHFITREATVVAGMRARRAATL